MVDRNVTDIDDFLRNGDFNVNADGNENDVNQFFRNENFSADANDLNGELQEGDETEVESDIRTEIYTGNINRNNVRIPKKMRLIAISTAGVLLIGTGVWVISNLFKKNDKGGDLDKPSITTTESDTTTTPALDDAKDISAKALENLGVELEFPKEQDAKKEYGDVVSGNIDVNKIVEDSDGTLWVDSEAASKKDEDGKTVIDDRNGQLVVKPNGEVFVPEVGYEIKNKEGNIIAEGNVGSNGLPSGFEYDKDTDTIRDKEHANSGLYVAPDGSYWKDKETYENYEKALKESNTGGSTNTPSKPTQSGSTFTFEFEDDEYYKDSQTGLTFQSKQHYEQWVLQGFDGYGIDADTGIMVPISKDYVKQR